MAGGGDVTRPLLALRALAMPNLFVADLQAVSYADIEAFLRESQEGVRVEYKEGPQERLGDAVAAFSNSYGGLVLVGVTNPAPDAAAAIVGVPRGRQDLRTRISSVILNTVVPRPRFSISVCDLPADPSREVAVVRVDEGPVPPYLWSHGGSNKVSVRHEAQNAAASLIELEALFGRRLEYQRPAGDIGLGVPPLAIESPQFVRVRVRPLPPLRLALDHDTDGIVAEAFRRAFKEASLAVPSLRTASTFEMELRREDEQIVFGVGEDGAVGAARTPPRSVGDPSQVSLIGLIEILVRTQVAAALALDAFGHPGRVLIELEMQLGAEKISPVLADAMTGIAGVGDLNRTSNRVMWIPASTVVDSSLLAEPWRASAYLLNRALRSARGAEIEMKVFEEFIKAYASAKFGARADTPA